MVIFQSFTGVITKIDNLGIGRNEQAGCNQVISVVNQEDSIINFVVLPTSYFLDHVMVKVGDPVTGFYDASAPTPYIYPPQLQALVMTRVTRDQNVKVDHFNRDLVSSDGLLRLNLSPATLIILENGQLFTGNIGNRDLIVVYGPTTRSIPAQTTPYKIVIMCR